MPNKLFIVCLLLTTILYSQHYKEKVKRLGLENCEKCHTTVKWDILKENIKFDHKKTGFDLGKQHENVDCNSCHTFKTKISEKKNCKDCHFDPHRKVIKEPINEAGDLASKAYQMGKNKGNNCEACHKETIWHKTEFKHEEFSKGFMLDGAHRNATCIQCHKTQNYSDAKSDCISCHKADYIKTTFPNHKIARFDKNCESCHTTYSWSQGRYYEHEEHFPILNGTHAGFSCKSCHNNPNNFKTITCTSCHTHSKGKTDNIHKGMSGYLYESKSCFSCHPRGRK